VALHRISFNRLDGYAVNDYFFYIYHGPELDIDSEVVDNLQTTIMRPVLIALENGVYTIDELVAHIRVMPRQHDDHPNYRQKWVVTKKTDIYGELQISHAPASTSSIDSDSDSDSDAVVSIPFSSNLINVNLGDGGTDIVYDSATGEVSRAASSSTEQIWARTSKPINLNSGHLVFDLASMSQVVQEPFNAFGIGRNYHPTKYTDTTGSFFDVQVRYLVSGEVILEQNILSDSGVLMEEIGYRDNGTTDADPDSAFKNLTSPMNILSPP
jgi:hypothetical protein